MSAARPPEGGSHRSRQAEGNPVTASGYPTGNSIATRSTEAAR
jgi:hypothetical protein